MFLPTPGRSFPFVPYLTFSPPLLRSVPRAPPMPSHRSASITRTFWHPVACVGLFAYGAGVPLAYLSLGAAQHAHAATLKTTLKSGRDAEASRTSKQLEEGGLEKAGPYSGLTDATTFMPGLSLFR